MTQQEDILYFGYGSISQIAAMAAILNHPTKALGNATLEGYDLHIQALDDVMVPSNAKDLLQAIWGPDFKSYGLRAANRNTQIRGTIFKLTAKDLELLDAWEMVSEGWFERSEATAQLETGLRLKVVVHILTDEQRSTCVDPADVGKFLITLEQLVEVARKMHNAELEKT